jgi:hypothetical protein
MVPEKKPKEKHRHRKKDTDSVSNPYIMHILLALAVQVRWHLKKKIHFTWRFFLSWSLDLATQNSSYKKMVSCIVLGLTGIFCLNGLHA